jgi:hypothetical protein
MAKKTNAYSEGYTAGQNSNDTAGSNPYNESEQYDQWSDWKYGYIDGLADKESEMDVDTDDYEDYEDDEDIDDDIEHDHFSDD